MKTDKSFLSTGEQTYLAKHRFRNPYELWQRFDELKNKQKEDDFDKERRELIHMYERKPHVIKRGGKYRSEPNWGVFRDAVDDYMKFFSSLALDRKIWCRIETFEGAEEMMDTEYSDAITEAFHKFCINTWSGRSAEIMSAIQDDCFFNRGHLHWKSPLDTYPCHVPCEDVYADTNATNCPKSFDLLFVRERLSAVKLYQRAIDPAYKDLGWKEKPILRALRNEIPGLKELSDKDILAQFRRGGISQMDQDRMIPLIYCYVREYNPAPSDHVRAGNQISLLVIPEELVAMGVKTGPDGELSKDAEKNAQLLKRSDYFQFVDFHAKDFDEVLATITPNTKKSFYNSSSFARQIFLGSKFHDTTTNALIRAVKRNMRLWIKTGSADTRKRIQVMDADEEVSCLTQEDEIAQVGMKQDVGAASELLRSVKGGINEFSPTEFGGTSTSPKGYPITKGEAQILSSQMDDRQKNAIKMFIANDEKLVKELYRRFVSSEESHDQYDNYKRFADYLKRKGVPAEAWNPENVIIYPRFNQFGGSASANYATANALVQATQLKPASKPEFRAKQSLIASIVGESNVSDYMDAPMQIDSELFIVGQENESLDNPINDAANVPVTPSDNHIMHIQLHMQDYMKKLGVGAQLLQAAAQDQTYRRQFLIEKAWEVIMSQDAKGAHIEAHFTMVASDETKQADVKTLYQQFREAQGNQDQLVAAVQAAQQQEVQANSRATLNDLEYQHKARMYQLDEDAKQAALNLDTEKKVKQTIISQEGADRKQAQKIAHKEQDQAQKASAKSQDVALEAAKKQIDLEAEREKLRMKKADKAKAAQSTTE
jgi:hypothetical protein